MSRKSRAATVVALQVFGRTSQLARRSCASWWSTKTVGRFWSLSARKWCVYQLYRIVSKRQSHISLTELLIVVFEAKGIRFSFVQRCFCLVLCLFLQIKWFFCENMFFFFFWQNAIQWLLYSGESCDPIKQACTTQNARRAKLININFPRAVKVYFVVQ